MPHLRRACLLHQSLTSLRAERSGAMAALELLPTAVWLLDAEGQLMFASRSGRELDARRDGLWIEHDGRPTAANPDERQALQRCIVRAIAAGQGFGLDSDGALRIRRSRTAEPLHAMVYPLARDPLLTGGAAAVFIFDPTETVVPAIELLKVFYGLTPAEARLACALAQGSTVAEYSATHRLTSNTVRTHLKRPLSKTGVHQQSQLVRLVAHLPVFSAASEPLTRGD